MKREAIDYMALALDWMAKGASCIGGLMVVAMMLLTVLDVFLRFAFNNPIIGVNEISTFMMVILGFMVIVRCTGSGTHLKVDILTCLLPPAICRKLDIVFSYSYFVVYLVIGWQTLQQALVLKAEGVTSDILKLPLSPFYSIVAFAAAVVALLVLVGMLSQLRESMQSEGKGIRSVWPLLLLLAVCTLVVAGAFQYEFFGIEIESNIAGIAGVLVLMGLLFARMWIGFAMAFVGFLGFAYLGGVAPSFVIMGTIPYSTLADYIITVFPLFIFMGVIVSQSGVGNDLFRAANAWFGHLPGGLGIATTGACAGFGAICGHSLAGTLTMGKVAIPGMQRYHYNNGLAAGCVAAGGSLSSLIPPSLSFILYALLTEQSVSRLFMAGILPGILLAALYIFVIIVITRINPALAPAGEKTEFSQKIRSLKYIWAILVLFLLVMGGIYGGIFTPTEAGAVGSFGAIVITLISRTLTPQRFLAAIRQTAEITGMVMAIIVGAYVFMSFLAISELPFTLAETIGDLTVNRYLIFAVIVILYIVLGMFLDVMACIIITVPVIFPVITTLGFDPIWFGVIVVILGELGLITPPIGMSIFSLSGVTGIPALHIFRGVLPFALMMLVGLLLLTIFPQIALFIPGLM